MNESHNREIIGGHLLVIGGAEDKYNERRILKRFLELAGGEKAEVLIVPVASDYPEFAADVYMQAFRNLGTANPPRGREGKGCGAGWESSGNSQSSA